MKPRLTKREKEAIEALGKLAETWPQSLKLFSAAGSLVVLKEPRTVDAYAASDGIGKYTVAEIYNIPNDGGDPGEY